MLLGIAALAIFLAQDQLRHSAAVKTSRVKVADEPRLDGVIHISPPIDAPDFALIDQHNEEFKFSRLRGRYALLSFGFTNCPRYLPADAERLSTG